LGHALSALIGFDTSRRLGGRFLVRIEDIDVARCREEMIAAIFEDLAWLGIEWDEPVLRQSQHFDVYAGAAQLLEAQGLLYPCFATRTEIWDAAADGARDPDGTPLYPGLHKRLPKEEIEARIARGEPYALRIDMERALAIAARLLDGAPLTFTELDDSCRPQIIAAHPERWGDAVILRKDVPASYHLAVVVDDARQGITHVTRGRDLYAATDLHRLLQVLLRLPEPLYQHHRLIADPEGRKLAKSEGDEGLASLRASGMTKADVRTRLGLA
jgi:glutamyl-Q tRNA(Asp) synthetase